MTYDDMYLCINAHTWCSIIYSCVKMYWYGKSICLKWMINESFIDKSNQVPSIRSGQPSPVNQVRPIRSGQHGPEAYLGGGRSILVYTWLYSVVNNIIHITISKNNIIYFQYVIPLSLSLSSHSLFLFYTTAFHELVWLCTLSVPRCGGHDLLV